MTKRVLLSLLTVLVIFCLCISALAVAGGVGLLASRRAAQNTPPTPQPPLPTLPAQLNPTPASDELPQDVFASMTLIQQQVISLRGLEQTAPLVRKVLTRDELIKRVQQDFFKDYTRQDAALDVTELSTLGLLPADFNLYDLYIALYGEQIAGFYDSETKEMVVIQGEGFQGPERMTYAHEFVHALQDQNYTLRGDRLQMTPEFCDTHSEQCAATQALIEGDASLVEQDWLQRYATAQDQKDITDFYATYSSPVYDSAPEFLRQDFLFPYQQGLEFVRSVVDARGESALNDLFVNPPQSTEQILHPEKLDDKPQTVSLPEILPSLGADWQEVDRNSLGEWYTYLVLAYGHDEAFRLDSTTARKAAAGWGGDAYAAFTDTASGQTAFALRTAWDSTTDAGEFWQSLQNYGRQRWGKPTAESQTRLTWQTAAEGAVTFFRSGDEIFWLSASDSEAAAHLDSAFAQWME